MSKIKTPPIPDKDHKPNLRFGYWSDVNKFPVITNFSYIIHWMWKHWGENGGAGGGSGEGGGSAPQQETVTYDLRTYFSKDSLVEAGEAESSDCSLVSNVIADIKAGKKVVLLDTASETDLGAPEFKYTVDLIHEKTGDSNRDFFTAHGEVIIAGEAGAIIPKLVCQIISNGSEGDKCYVSVNP